MNHKESQKVSECTYITLPAGTYNNRLGTDEDGRSESRRFKLTNRIE